MVRPTELFSTSTRLIRQGLFRWDHRMVPRVLKWMGDKKFPKCSFLHLPIENTYSALWLFIVFFCGHTRRWGFLLSKYFQWGLLRHSENAVLPKVLRVCTRRTPVSRCPRNTATSYAKLRNKSVGISWTPSDRPTTSTNLLRFRQYWVLPFLPKYCNGAFWVTLKIPIWGKNRKNVLRFIRAIKTKNRTIRDCPVSIRYTRTQLY